MPLQSSVSTTQLSPQQDSAPPLPSVLHESSQAAHVPATEPHPMVSTQRIVVFAAGHTKEATPSSGLAPPCPHAMLLGS